MGHAEGAIIELRRRERAEDWRDEADGASGGTEGRIRMRGHSYVDVE